MLFLAIEQRHFANVQARHTGKSTRKDTTAAVK